MFGRRIAAGIARAMALATTLAAGAAFAGAFGVTPLRIDLDGAARTGLITVSSDDDRRLHFQVKLFQWSQDAAGEDVYVESSDLVFFPQIFTVEPRQKRAIRVGTKGAPPPAEKAYRLFIEEMPDPAEAAASGAQVAVRLRFGVPIFSSDGKGAPKLEVIETRAGKGEVLFKVRNHGDRQIRFDDISLLKDGRTVGQHSGWYVFPGLEREFKVPVARDACPLIGRIDVRATGEGKELRSSLEAPGDLCER